MAKITREDILKLAKLSMLELTDEQVENFTKEIGSIIEFVEQLQNIDVAELKTVDQAGGLTNIWRDDEPINYQASPKDLLSKTTDVLDDQIRVKRVIE